MLSNAKSQFLATYKREQAGLAKIRELAVRNEELEARNRELEKELNREWYVIQRLKAPN